LRNNKTGKIAYLKESHVAEEDVDCNVRQQVTGTVVVHAVEDHPAAQDVRGGQTEEEDVSES
jgi:hypothetical protein